MIKAMTVGIFLAVFASPLFAQDDAAAARAAAGCGPDSIKFEVKTDKNQHPAPQAEPTKALVYVFQDVHQDNGLNIGTATTRLGLDGAWVGAIHGKSYFFFSAEPGIIACVQPGNPASRESPNWLPQPI